MGFFASLKILFLFCIFVSGESIAVSRKLSECRAVMQYSIFVTQKKSLLLFFDQLWLAMCTQIIQTPTLLSELLRRKTEMSDR